MEEWASHNMSHNYHSRTCQPKQRKQTHSKTSRHHLWALVKLPTMAQYLFSPKMVSQYTKIWMCASHAKENHYWLEYAMNEDITLSHSSNGVGKGSRSNPQNRHESVCARPTASMIYHPWNRPSNGCMRYMDTQLSQLGSRQWKQATILVGKC